MRVQNVQNVIVGAMVQLLDCWFLAMFVSQPAAVVFVTLSKPFILNLLDANNLWHAIVEGCRSHELGSNFITFGTIQWNIHQSVPCSFCWAPLVIAPTWACEPQILSTAETGNPLWTFLPR
jgi:hypothetical protein